MVILSPVSLVPRKILNSKGCTVVLSRRPLSINRTRQNNKVNLELHFLPLPSANNYRNDVNRKLPESNKRFRYVGYSNQQNCVTSISILQELQLNERLTKAAQLYDGWFSRDVENLDLAPTSCQ